MPICQVVLYLISEKMNLKYGRIVLLLMILIGHIYIFPSLFHPDPDPNGMDDGVPLIHTFVFWMIGVGTAIIVHLIYILIKKLMKIRPDKSSLNEPLDYNEK